MPPERGECRRESSESVARTRPVLTARAGGTVIVVALGTVRVSVTIEAGTLDAADAVADLWVELAEGQRAHGSHLAGQANRAQARDTIAQRAVTGGLLVARADDELVGFVTFSKEQGSYEQSVDRGLIHDLFVRPDYRDRGIGSRLVEGAERRLAQENVDAVSLEVLAANEAARRFYARHGYEPHRLELEKSLGNDTHTTQG